MVKRFNDIMARIYARAQPAISQSFGGNIPDRLAGVFDEREMQLSMIADTSASKKAIADVMLERHENCDGHPTYVHVSADIEEQQETMIETLTADCGNKSSPKWCTIQWIRSHAKGPADIQFPRPSHRICGQLKVPHRKMIRIEIKPDKIIPRSVLIKTSSGAKSTSGAQKPHLKLSALLRAVQGSTDIQASELAKQLRKGKSLRISLGFRIARSILYLVGSALIQSHWKADDLLVPPSMDVVHDIVSDLKVYVDDVSNLTTDAPQPIKHFVLELGVLLWELFFLEEIKVLEEDRDLNEEDSLYNALYRTYEDSSTARCLQPICLEIINNCLSAYDDLEEGMAEADIRANIYDRIVKPLQELAATYSDTSKPQPVSLHEYNATWEDKEPIVDIQVDRIVHVESVSQAAYQYSNDNNAFPSVDEVQLFRLDLANVLDGK